MKQNQFLFVLVFGSVCMATATRNSLRTSLNQMHEANPCGIHTAADRIIGGVETEIEEFPWTALLFYRTDKGLRHKCGGTLIKKRTIVTAAHCLEGGLKKTFEFVRLGEWNTTSDVYCPEDECTDDCECSDPHVDFKHKEIIIHPSRAASLAASKHDDDIALIILEEDPPYTVFIRPICLPVTPFQDDKGSLLNVAGWGSTTQFLFVSSDVKQKLKVNAVPYDDCKEVFLKLGVTLDANKMICAGAKRNKNICAGDSGGPLMSNKNTKHYLTGVIAFGTKPCAEEGIPGVFINVWSYLDWINANSM